jgi:phage tail protein X
MALYVVKREGVSLDLACWLHYHTGKNSRGELPGGTVERVLNANPEIAWLPIHLPLGTKLAMPELPVKQQKSVVRLWD